MTGKEKIIADKICWAEIDLDQNKSFTFGCVIERLLQKLILGEPWMTPRSLVDHARDRTIFTRKYEYFV